MSGMELNKLMAAVLVAGIVASLSGFIAREVLHPHELHEDAIKIEGAEEDGAAGGPAKPALPEPILAMIAGADVARGETISKACTACHTFDKGGASGTGPNLWGVIARDKGGVSGFAYSEAMLGQDGNWNYDALNHFLWKPKAYVPGTKMNYIGLKKPEDRAALIAWLRTRADAPPALPTDSEIAAEQAELAPVAEEAAPAGEAAEVPDAATEAPVEAPPSAH